MNSNLENSGEYKQMSTIDVSIAVATDKGLITPIIKNADKLSVQSISEQAKVKLASANYKKK
jgi:pyruvate dehydrogenase E2 component (dihydrolipoamide acetyltransferase)